MNQLTRKSVLTVVFLCGLTNGLQCGEVLTTPCLGSSDIRYDPKASNDASDQADVWKKFGGYFIGKGTVQVLFDGADELSSAYQLTLFINNTIQGSRMYIHRIELNSLNDIDFRDNFATTTYEKDGTMSFVTGDPKIKDASDVFTAYPVDENSAFFTFKAADGDVGSESWYALDSEANKARIISDQFKDVKGSLVLSKTYSAFEDRVTEKEWIAAVNAAFKETGIPKRNLTAIPMKSDCMSDKFCPTQADWCLRDPTCSVSPYQEPSASMKPGATAGFVIGGIAVLLTLFYIIHKYLSSQQIKRYKTIFAKRIAETIQVNKSIRSMEPEELAEEFKRVDLQTDDGMITKDDLWEFISSGKAGEITQSDFNALFAAIDADGDGQVDFLAFCAFMGQCHDEYRQARADRSKASNNSSRRLELADKAARASFRRISSSADLDDGFEINMRPDAPSELNDEEEQPTKRDHDQ